MNPSLTSKFQLLRMRIESDLKPPAVLMVTSAQANDGKSLTAFGLADSLAKAGHRVVVVDTSARPMKAADLPAATLPRPDRYVVAGLPVDESGARSTREAIAGFVAQMRASYEFTIIDAAPLMNNSVALLLAGAVDAVLLAIRHGRAPCEDDELMVQTLRHARSRVLGVVASTPATIANFNSSRTSSEDGKSRLVALEPTVDDVSSAALFAQ